MRKLIFILSFAFLSSCKDTKPLSPFELILYNHDYAMAFSKKYVLTERNLSITLRGELEGERDSTIFSIKLNPTKDLRTLSNLDFGSMKDEYINDCVDDGYQMSLVFTKDSLKKTIHLSNYHQKDVSFAIELINKMVPKNNQIYYDKEELLESMKGCN